LSRITWSISIWIQISLLFPLLALIPVSFKSISSMESVERLYINSKRLA
jgi:peptidoglycan/LPS O-acetylase OafA/YrhL